MGLWMAGLGTILGAVNFITTIICMRAPGMTMFRMPIFVWNTMVTSLLVLIAFPVLAGALLSLEADRRLGAHVFDTAHGGPILWQHLFWFFDSDAVRLERMARDVEAEDLLLLREPLGLGPAARRSAASAARATRRVAVAGPPNIDPWPLAFSCCLSDASWSAVSSTAMYCARCPPSRSSAPAGSAPRTRACCRAAGRRARRDRTAT